MSAGEIEYKKGTV